jgi:CheY-like chemotaxis protein
MKVLIADDEADIRDLLAEFLTLRGFEILEAANGLETLLQVKRHIPDAVLLDLRMPRLGGIDALKRIRSFNAAINVIVITAEADSQLHDQALAGGARAVLPKPVDLSAVLDALAGDVTPTMAAKPAAVPATPTAVPATPTAVPATPTAVPATAVSAPAASGPVPRVLVVDDEPEIRDMLSEFLALHKYRVTTAADGASAVRLLAQTAPAVILLDIDMPGLSGVDALPTLKALSPATAVIMVSGTADLEVAKRALAAGAFDYATKPVDLSRLLETIETAVATTTLSL